MSGDILLKVPGKVTQSSDIDHDQTTNTHNLTTDIDHNQLTNYTVGEHRTINDSGTDSTDLWSADKINTELAGKTDTGHTHTESDITDLDHTDTDAIHDNVAGEINAISEKTTPVSADLLIIEDSADTNNKKKVQIGNLPGGGVFGTQYFYTESLGESTQSASFFFTKVVHQRTSLPLGDYETVITGEYRSDGSGTCEVRITESAVNMILPANSTANYQTFSLVVKKTISSTTLSYTIQWRRSVGSGTTYIRNVRARTFRVA